MSDEVSDVVVVALLTICVSAVEVDPRLLRIAAIDRGDAVAACVSDKVVKLAAPPASVTADPRLVAPSLNCTVPVGEAPVTVAVKVTAWPTMLGLSDEIRAAVVTA